MQHCEFISSSTRGARSAHDKAAETIVDIQLCEAEVWLMQTLLTIMQSTERKSEDGSAKILK